jgi:predicted PurR-regulated permease PerM
MNKLLQSPAGPAGIAANAVLSSAAIDVKAGGFPVAPSDSSSMAGDGEADSGRNSRAAAQNGAATHPVARSAADPATHAAADPASHATTDSAAHAAAQPAAHVAAQPAAHAATQPTYDYGTEKVAGADAAPIVSIDTAAERPLASAAAPLTRVAVDARGLAICIVAVVAGLFALQWAKNFLVPLFFSIFIAYTLNPLVRWLERIRVPRVFGASLVMLSIMFAVAAAGSTLSMQFESIVEGLPTATKKITQALTDGAPGETSLLRRVQQAAAEIERATSQAAGGRSTAARAADGGSAAFKINDWVLAGSVGAMQFLGQTTMVLFLVFFLLLAGDTFKRKMVKLTGPTLTKKKITVHILDDINTSIQNYMFMLLVTNVLLAVMMWIALRAIGLQNAGAWGVAAGFLHVIPYFGPLLITVATALTAFLQFGTPGSALLVGAASLLIATVVGTFVTTWMTGRIAKMNPAAVFIGLLFWGWIWGVWGLLLGVPIIVVVKVIAEHVDGMLPLAELLGE